MNNKIAIITGVTGMVGSHLIDFLLEIFEICITTIQERGKTYSMVISWRGKLINSQMFFPSFKRPTKAEITAEVQKVYPTAIVMYFNPAMRDPTQPMLFGGQET